MNSAIAHRGPDDHGLYNSPDQLVSLAMRRLSILDLHGGHQPMSNHDGTVWVVYNGEIYNSPELRCELKRKGYRFKTDNSDTEVLVHLYEEKGQALVHDLNGMFAFVIHDQKKNVLFGARDRVGIKPLYYFQQDSRFALASELKALLSLPWIERILDPQSLFHYMTLLYIPGDRSILKGIHRLPPGYSFIYDLARHELKLQQYWKLNVGCVENRSEEEWAELLRAELRAAVRRWSLSDVPIACSLSGGLDSSALVGVLAEQGFPRIKTYSVGFEGEGEEAWNELVLARQVAQRWATEHHEIVLKPQELLKDLVAMVWYLDEPYGGGLPSWYVYREMAKDVKVALTGTGGDELFGNYGKFSWYEDDWLVLKAVEFRNRFRLPAEKLAQLAGPLASLSEWLPPELPMVGRGRWLSKFPRLLRQPFGDHYYANFVYLSDAQKRQFVLSTNNGALLDTAAYLQQVYDSTLATDLRDGLAAVDFQTQLAEEFLFMTDRFSMSHSIEARVPFLDHKLVELVFRIPSAVRMKSNDLKYLFKLAVGDLLPREVLRAPKRGFVIPIELWLRQELRPLAERLLAPDRLAKQGIFRKEFYSCFVEPHLTGKANYTWQVWAALMYQLWHEIFLEQSATSAPSFFWKDLC